MTCQLKLFSHPKLRSVICGMQAHFLGRQLKRMNDVRLKTLRTWTTISIQVANEVANTHILRSGSSIVHHNIVHTIFVWAVLWKNNYEFHCQVVKWDEIADYFLRSLLISTLYVFNAILHEWRSVLSGQIDVLYSTECCTGSNPTRDPNMYILKVPSDISTGVVK